MWPEVGPEARSVREARNAVLPMIDMLSGVLCEELGSRAIISEVGGPNAKAITAYPFENLICKLYRMAHGDGAGSWGNQQLGIVVS